MLTGLRGITFFGLLATYALLAGAQFFGGVSFGIGVLLGIYCTISAAVLAVVRGRIEHPATLFTLVFFFYVIGYPIVVELGLLPDFGVLPRVITLHTIGYLGFVLPTLLRKPTPIPNFSRLLPSDSIAALRLGVIVLIFLGILQMTVSLATGSYKGGAWKYSILATGAPQIYLVVAASILLSQRMFCSRRLSLWLPIVTVICASAPLLITGRRTPGVIAILTIVVLVEIRRRKLNLLKLMALMVIGFVSFGVSKYYSTVLTTSRAPTASVESLVGGGWIKVIGVLFYKEFKTSGRLTAASIVYGKSHGFPTYGASYLQRLENSLAPGFLSLQDHGNTIGDKLAAFITDGGADVGLGYSIIAEGYNNFGVPGVFLNLFVLGAITSTLYRRAGRSPVWLAGYVVFLAIICTRLRSGTLSIYLMSFYSLLLPIGLLSIARLAMYSDHSSRLFLSRRGRFSIRLAGRV